MVLFFVGCATTNPAHTLYYDSKQNPAVNLLGWEYSDNQQPYRQGTSKPIGWISLTSHKIGNYFEITWQDLNKNAISTERLDITNNFPAFMQNSEVRLTFNKLNQPEIFVFYESSTAHDFFWFQGRPYNKKKVRQIYPLVREVEIDINKKN